MKHIEIEETGLQCDNTKCDWVDTTIKFEDYKQYINACCPKCGENILTELDYGNAVHLHASINYINSLTPEALDELNKFAENEMLIHPGNFSNIAGAFDFIVEEGNPQNLDSGIKISTHKKIKIEKL